MHSDHHRVQVLIDVKAFVLRFMFGFLFGLFLGWCFRGASSDILFHNVTILLILFSSITSFLIIISKLMPKWEVNLSSNPSSLAVQRQYEQIVEPFGFSKDTTPPSAEAPRRRDLLQNKIFEVATASKSQILMTVFMFWMFGNNISIFVLFPIIQTLTSAVGGLLNMQKVFEPYEGMMPSLTKYKLMYSAIQLVLLGIVVYKLSMMGLLPVSAADYVDLIQPFDTLKVMARA